MHGNGSAQSIQPSRWYFVNFARQNPLCPTGITFESLHQEQNHCTYDILIYHCIYVLTLEISHVFFTRINIISCDHQLCSPQATSAPLRLQAGYVIFKILVCTGVCVSYVYLKAATVTHRTGAVDIVHV